MRRGGRCRAAAALGRGPEVACKDHLVRTDRRSSRPAAGRPGGGRRAAAPVLAALALCLQGCGQNDEGATLKSPILAGNSSHPGWINETRVGSDCTGRALAEVLNRSTAAFRQAAAKNIPEDIAPDVRSLHIDMNFPEDAARFFMTSEESGFLRKATVYCHVLELLPDGTQEDQQALMAEEVQGRANHILQFLHETAAHWQKNKNVPERLKDLKAHWKLLNLDDKSFCRLREAVLPMKEEQVRAALRAVIAFSGAGCLKQYFEETRKEDVCDPDKVPFAVKGRKGAACGAQSVLWNGTDAKCSARCLAEAKCRFFTAAPSGWCQLVREGDCATLVNATDAAAVTYERVTLLLPKAPEQVAPDAKPVPTSSATTTGKGTVAPTEVAKTV